MSELLLSAEALVVPVRPGSKPLALDMRKIHKAEARLVELNGLTREKAGELIYTFVDAWDDARSKLTAITFEYALAKQHLRSIKALVILDRAADVLKEKGVKSSEDTRTAVVDTDKDYQTAYDLLQQIEAARQSMEDKAEKLKMAYFSVHKLIEPFQAKKSFSGGADDDPTEETPGERVQKFISENTKPQNYVKGFGGAKY